MFAIKFEYDNGVHISNKICFVNANTREEAAEIFKNNIYGIFDNNEDVCKIIAITKIPEDTKIIYGQSDVMWAIGKGKLIW